MVLKKWSSSMSHCSVLFSARVSACGYNKGNCTDPNSWNTQSGIWVPLFCCRDHFTDGFIPLYPPANRWYEWWFLFTDGTFLFWWEWCFSVWQKKMQCIVLMVVLADNINLCFPHQNLLHFCFILLLVFPIFLTKCLITKMPVWLHIYGNALINISKKSWNWRNNRSSRCLQVNLYCGQIKVQMDLVATN